MKSEIFNDNIDKIYNAIRKAYGYTDKADELIDFVIDMAGVAEDEMTEE